MDKQLGSQNGGRSRTHATGVLLTCLLLAAAVFLTAIPTAWATPGEAPQNTIPTPTPTTEKKEKRPAVLTPEPMGRPSETIQVPLGPGDGVYNLKMPNAGCIQINVYGLPWQVLFDITPLLPDTVPVPPPGCYRTTVAYALKAWNTLTGQPVDTIVPDYKHTICYTDADLAAANGDPNKFVISYYDEAQKSWQNLDPTEIDQPNRHATGATDHASLWALFACDLTTPMMLPETGEGGDAVPPAVLITAALGVLLLGVGAWWLRVVGR